jgi:basic membrane protein A
MAQLIDEGADIIVTSGFLLESATREAGEANPDVKFIGTDQFQTTAIANVAGLIYREDIGGYLAGALAGLKTTTNSVGGYYGCTVPAVNKFAIGFANGFWKTNPGGTVTNIFPGDTFDFANCFTNEDWGRTGATTLIDPSINADVIFAAAGGAGNGALKQGCEDGKLVIGVDVDQYYSVPEVQSCIVSSAIKDMVNDVADVIEKIANDQFVGGNVYGNSVLAPFHAFEDQITDADKQTLDDLLDMITGGTIDSCEYWDDDPAKSVEPFITLGDLMGDKDTLCPPESY